MHDIAPDALAALPVAIILNVGSGHDDKPQHRREIEAAFAVSGREHRVYEVASAGEIRATTRRAVDAFRERPGIVVAAGGDGTLNAVAGELLGTGLPLGVIPMGTFNYFARDLGIPLEPAAAVQAIVAGRLRRVSVATVNGNVFLNNASFGLYRHLLEEREQYKQRFGRYKVVAIFAALITLWRHRRVYTVQLEVDGRPVNLATPMIFFGLNSLQLENLDLEAAACTAQGLIALIALRPMRRLEMLGFALRGALQGLRETPNLRCYCASRVEVRWRGAHRTKVAVDGESVDCDLPLEITALRDALPVIVPRQPEERK